MTTTLSTHIQHSFIHPHMGTSSAVSASLDARSRVLAALFQVVIAARQQNGASGVEVAQMLQFENGPQDSPQQRVLNHCRTVFGADFEALRQARSDQEVWTIAERLVLRQSEFDLQRDFIQHFRRNFRLNAQVDATENIAASATEALLREIRTHSESRYQQLMQGTMGDFANQHEIFSAFRRMTVLGGNNLERFNVLSNQGASVISLLVCGSLGRSRNPQAYAMSALAGGVIGLVQGAAGLWAQLRHEDQFEILQRSPLIAWQLTKSTLIGSLSGMAECAGGRYIQSGIIRFFAAEVGGEVAATALLDRVGRFTGLEERQNFEASAASSFLANAIEEKMGGAHSFLLQRSSHSSAPLVNLPAPAWGLAGLALTISNFINPEIANAMSKITTESHHSLFPTFFALAAGLTYLLRREKPDGSFEPLKGKYWNEHGQSTRVVEALQMIKDGNLEAARNHLKDVHLVTVLGSGRHGIGLDKMSAQTTQGTQKLFGKPVVHVLLTYNDATNRTAADKMNYEGTNHFVGGSQINTDDRCALHNSDPQYNDALLQLADTVIVSLPTAQLKNALTPDRIKKFKPNTQLLVGMKSVGEDGSGIPASMYLLLAKQGRFDLMWNLAFQTGLGFPEEMVGHESPTQPVIFSVDSANPEAALRGAQVLCGDEAMSRAEGRFVSAQNKVIQIGDQVFLAAYLAYMKNVLAPDDGYRFCDWVINGRQKLKPFELEDELCRYRQENEETLVSIFSQHEAAKINAERATIEAMLDEGFSSAIGKEYLPQLKAFFVRRETTNEADIRAAFIKNETGLEDLKGCTRLRHEDTFLNILNQLLDSEGLAFEEALAALQNRLQKEASSTNFFAGIGRRLNEELVKLGKVLPQDLAAREAADKKPIEGLYAMPSLKLRWDYGANEPAFVTRTQVWNKAAYIAGKPRLHKSGMSWQSILVIRDYITRLQNARGEASIDFMDDANYQKSITRMRDNLVALIAYLNKQKNTLATNPNALQSIEKVLISISDTQKKLSQILTEWNQSPSRLTSFLSGANNFYSSFVAVRRNRPHYKVRESLSHRLEALYLQLQKQFKLEEDNLAHWKTQERQISRLNTEIGLLGYLDRVMRFEQRE